MFPLALLAAAILPISADSVKDAFDGRDGALVILDSAGQTVLRYNEASCEEKLPPCSTFKIWNTAIGLETGLITDPDAPFWKWDGKKRAIDAWNHDQTVRSAFAASCVPAYQALARKIGVERMAEYLHKLSYGNEDISAGIDIFWLPEPGRKTLLITPTGQAQMIARLVGGKLSLSPHTRSVLKDVMKVKSTEHGTLYGKTGTSGDAAGKPSTAWLVGYVESGGSEWPFACVIKAHGAKGTDARAVVEKVFSKAGLF